MAWTHFKLTELGERTNALINGLPASIGVWYANTDVLSVEKQNAAHYGEPFDVLKYQVTDGTQVSNTANLVVNCSPNKSISPSSSNETVNATTETIYDVINNIPYSAGVDRIKIVEFEINGEITLNGVSIFPGLTIFHYDFENLKYKTGLGIGNPYQKIKYQVGNLDGYDATIYELDYNIVGLASLLELTEQDGEADLNPDNPPNPDTNYKEATFKITNGTPFGQANFDFTINLNAGAFPSGTDNTVILTANGNSQDFQNNLTINQTVDLDENGECYFELEAGFLITDTITGDITIDLLEIDGNNGLVDVGNNQIAYTGF